MPNKFCEKFQGRNTCDFFISNGACSRPDKFMCHVFIDTHSQPINDDVPIHLGEVLREFPDSKVVKEINPEPRGKQKKMEEFFGKI